MGKKKDVYKVKPLTEGKKNNIAGLMEEYDIETADDIQEALKDLLGGTIKGMMEAEMDDHLGYEKHERSDSDNARNRSYGMRGNFTKNDQPQGRELLTPDEVRMLDNQFALLFIRGERPVKDLKYDILKHPNVGMTTDGKAEPYIYGKADGASFSVEFLQTLGMPEVDHNAEPSGLELLSEEDVEKMIASEEKEVESNES